MAVSEKENEYEGLHLATMKFEVMQDDARGPFGAQWYWRLCRDHGNARGPFPTARAAFEDAAKDEA